MEKYTTGEIAALLGGELLGSGKEVVRHLLTDSRTVHRPEETLFVAIKGERHDGHSFIPDLKDRGGRCLSCRGTAPCPCPGEGLLHPRQGFPESPAGACSRTQEEVCGQGHRNHRQQREDHRQGMDLPGIVARYKDCQESQKL